MLTADLVDCPECKRQHHRDYVHADNGYEFRCMRCEHQWRTKVAGDVPKACSKCIAPDMMVSGTNQDIQLVSKDDVVLSKNGRHITVNRKFKHKYSGELISIKAGGCLKTLVTPEHKVWVVTCVQKCNGKHRKFSRIFSRPYYKLACQLRLRPLSKNINSIGDYLVIPRVKTNSIDLLIDLTEFTTKHGLATALGKGMPIDFPVTLETAWLLGLFVAEGHADKNGGITFSLGAHEVELVQAAKVAIQYLGYSPYEVTKDSVTSVGFGSHLLARAFRQWMGTDCYTKHIPDFLLYNFHEEYLARFLCGYIAGDGHIESTKNQNGYMLHAGTASKALALQLQLLSVRLGGFFGISLNDHSRYVRKPLKTGRIIKGGLYYQLQSSSAKLLEAVGINHMDRHNKSYVVFDDYVAVPICELSEVVYDGLVYNMSTESGDYLVNNLAVKNCHSAYWDRPRSGKFITPAKAKRRKIARVKVQKKIAEQHITHSGMPPPPSVRMGR